MFGECGKLDEGKYVVTTPSKTETTIVKERRARTDFFYMEEEWK